MGVDPGEIVKRIVQGGDAAELALDSGGISGHRAHRRGRPQQQDQKRNGKGHLRDVLHPVAPAQNGHNDQGQPPPQLAAQIGREDRDDRPQPLAAEYTQHDGQCQVGVDGVEILPPSRIDAKIDHRLKQIDGGGGGGHPQDIFPVPADVAEGGGQNDAEQAHRHRVADVQAHRNTCFRWKAYSRYRSFSSPYFPRGMGSSARLAMVMALGMIFLT